MKPQSDILTRKYACVFQIACLCCWYFVSCNNEIKQQKTEKAWTCGADDAWEINILSQHRKILSSGLLSSLLRDRPMKKSSKPY